MGTWGYFPEDKVAGRGQEWWSYTFTPQYVFMVWCLVNFTFIYLSMVLQHFFLDLSRFFSFLILYTIDRTPWTGIRPSQGRYLHKQQHKHRINAYRHPCLEWDSNPRSQRSSERRQFIPQTVRPLWWVKTFTKIAYEFYVYELPNDVRKTPSYEIWIIQTKDAFFSRNVVV
jgi:hypothetical protein